MKLLSCCWKQKSRRDIVLLLVGLDNAGKTTAAKGLSKQDVFSVLPTAGFSSVKLRHRGYNVTIYDLGGGPQIREIWPRYFSDIHGVMFVIDASDMDRVIESKRELKRLVMSEKIARKPILVLANKQDKEGAMDEIDIIEKLSLEPLINAQKCPTRVEMCSFHSKPQNSSKMDPGLLSGYRWLLGLIIKQYKDLNERVEKDSQMEKNNRAEVREAWRRKKGLVKDSQPSVDLPYQTSPTDNLSLNERVTTLHNHVGNHLPSIARDENSSLETVIHNGTVEVITHHRPVTRTIIVSPSDNSITHHPVPKQFVVSGQEDLNNSSYLIPHTPPSATKSNSSSSSTLPVRKQLEQKSFVQRQKSFSAHGSRSKNRCNADAKRPVNSTSPVLTLTAVDNQEGHYDVLDRLSEGHARSTNAMELPPVRPPGVSRPMTTRSLGRSGKAWDLHLPLEISVPDDQYNKNDDKAYIF